MKPILPAPPGNMDIALTATEELQKQLKAHGIYAFDWPQSMDSGIDLVAFATIRRGQSRASDRATAFVAGFQSKGTDDHFTEAQARSVNIENHEDYWKSSTLPVFVARISTDGAALLIEDAWSTLNTLSIVAPWEKRRKSIPTTVPFYSAATDIRLRMFAHALAPWISLLLRSRPLSHKDAKRHLNPQSAWSLLDYAAGQYSAFPIPSSWTDIRQYFTLLTYLYEDLDCQTQLVKDVQKAVAMGSQPFEDDWDANGPTGKTKHQTGAFRLLAGVIELFLRFDNFKMPSASVKISSNQAARARNDFHEAWRNDDTRENEDAYFLANDAYENPMHAMMRIDVEAAIDIICDIWAGCAKSVSQDAKTFAESVFNLCGTSLTGPAESVIRTVAMGKCELKTALRSAILPWAGRTLYVNHWRDVVGKASILDLGFEKLDSPESGIPFRSYQDFKTGISDATDSV